jgi:hypothetical protein
VKVDIYQLESYICRVVRYPQLGIIVSNRHCSSVKETRSLSMRYGRQSTKRYAQGSRLSAYRCASYELDGDARQTQGFIQVRSLWGRNTYVLRQIVLLYLERCNEMYDLSSRGPLPLLIYSGGGGLQVKYLIWYYYNI